MEREMECTRIGLEKQVKGGEPADESKRVKGFVFFPFTYHLSAMTYDLHPYYFMPSPLTYHPITLNLTPLS